MGHMVEDRHLRAALDAALAAEPRVTVLRGQPVVAQEAGPGRGRRRRWPTGTRLEARLLVGADGRGSGTAQRARASGGPSATTARPR